MRCVCPATFPFTFARRLATFSTMTSSEIIKAQLEVFFENHPELLCSYLFGSAIHNRMHADSDIDIAVAGTAPLSAGHKQRLREELEQIFRRDVDLIDLHSATGNILRQALHGNCILCRNKSIRYQLQRRLIYDQEDMQPLRKRIMDTRRMRFAYGH